MFGPENMKEIVSSAQLRAENTAPSRGTVHDLYVCVKNSCTEQMFLEKQTPTKKLMAADVE